MVKSKPEKRKKATAKNRAPAKKRATVRKKATTREKTPAKKKAAGKKKISATKTVSPKDKKSPSGKKTASKRKAAANKKAPVQKGPIDKRAAAPRAGIRDPKAGTGKTTRRARRITRMTLQEVLISLTTLAEQWGQFEWLDGIVLYGPRLRDSKAHREFSFMVVHHGLRTAAQARAARAQLDTLLKTAVPVKRRLHLVNEPGLLEKIQQEDPAVEALLGQPIAIWVRSG